MKQTSILKDKKVSQDDLIGSDWERISHTQNKQHTQRQWWKEGKSDYRYNKYVYWDGGKNGRRAKILSFSMKEEAGLLDRKSTV